MATRQQKGTKKKKEDYKRYCTKTRCRVAQECLCLKHSRERISYLVSNGLFSREVAVNKKPSRIKHSINLSYYLCIIEFVYFFHVNFLKDIQGIAQFFIDSVNLANNIKFNA